MLKDLPDFIPLLFILTTALTLLFFLGAVRKNTSPGKTLTLSAILLAWLGVHAILGIEKFYTVLNTLPPRFVLLIAPPLLAILVLFITKPGKRFINSFDLKILTQLHIVRVFVELIFLWLLLYRFIPKIMTFEGSNFDILAGVTAPLIVYFGLIKRRLSRTLMLVWNIIAMALLLNIVIIAVLSAPFPFQKFAFDQPNTAILYFPFVWLPCFIVPAVLFSHLVFIRRLSKGNPV